MKKLFILLTAVLMTAGFAGCRFDDSDLWDELNGQEERLSQLEQKVNALNSDVASIRTIVEALQGQDMITGVVALTDGSGYTISFSKHSPITIKNGQNGTNGTNGTTPVIAVVQEGGVYYWTVNGVIMKDSFGNGIPVTGNDGQDGQDGITPQLRINETTLEWEISTDNGANWVSTGIVAQGQNGATGPQGPAGSQGPQGPAGPQGSQGPAGESLFRSVDTSDARYVAFTLADGTVFTVMRYAAPSLTFTNLVNGVFEVGNDGATYDLMFTSTGSIVSIGIASSIPTGWTVSADQPNNRIRITSTMTGDLNVLIVATDDNGASASYWITLSSAIPPIVVSTVAQLVNAVTSAANGDVIALQPGTFALTGPLVLNDNITIKSSGGPGTTTIQTDGTFNAIQVTGTAVTIDGITIQQTADVTSGSLALIHLTGNADGTVIQNSTFIGSYDLAANDPQVVRAILSDAGHSLTIIGNTFINVRQPAYIEGPAVIKNNYADGTKGWVITQNSIVDMTGNTFGTNAVDIAIINNNMLDQGNYNDVRTQELHTLNSNAHVENQVLTRLTDHYGAYYSVDESGTTYFWENPNYVP